MFKKDFYVPTKLNPYFFKCIRTFLFCILVMPNIIYNTIIAEENIGQSMAHEEVVNKKSFYDFAVNDVNGKSVNMGDFKGKVVVIANIASKCGFTPQLKDLEEIYKQYAERGVVVLGFPSNDFLGQEPLPDNEIKKFCSGEYGVTFPLFTKQPVSGKEIQPIFKFLTQESGKEFEGSVKWNFEKFILDRNGILRARFGSFTNPMSSKIIKQIEELL